MLSGKELLLRYAKGCNAEILCRKMGKKEIGLRDLPVAKIYLEHIAREKNLSPLSFEVVEAYFLGNELSLIPAPKIFKEAKISWHNAHLYFLKPDKWENCLVYCGKVDKRKKVVKTPFGELPYQFSFEEVRDGAYVSLHRANIVQVINKEKYNFHLKLWKIVKSPSYP